MSDFEGWFLLVYTGYIVISIFALLWVTGDDSEVNERDRVRRSR